MPGDHVRYAASGDPDLPWVIEEILPRRNELARPAIANLDILLITVAVSRPEPDFFLIDRLLVCCFGHGIEPVLVLNKMDEANDEIVERLLANYKPVGCPIVQTGLSDHDSIQELRQHVKGRVVSFAGQSGGGKSTILNRLFDEEHMPTGTLSERIGRGRHTTRHAELFPMEDGGFIADTPGFSSLLLSDLGFSSEQLVFGYPELLAIEENCRFRSCRHLNDLGCAVEHSTIHPERLERYRTMRRELDELERAY